MGSAGFCFNGVFGKAVFRRRTHVFTLETISVLLIVVGVLVTRRALGVTLSSVVV